DSTTPASTVRTDAVALFASGFAVSPRTLDGTTDGGEAMTAPACPHPDALRAFAPGSCSDSDAAPVEEHLRSCRRRLPVGAAGADDGLTGTLRALATARLPRNPLIDQLAPRLHALRAEEAGRSATQHIDPDTASSATDASAGAAAAPDDDDTDVV